MSTFTLRSGADNHPEDSVLQLHTDLVRAGGVLDLVEGGFLVTQRGAGANMSVDVDEGRGYVKKTGNAYPIRTDAVVNVAISANASGNPRKDVVVAYLDLSADPSIADDGSGLVLIVKVNGTPGASPVAPDASAIATAIGGSNPYIILAEVAVANGASSIVNANILDARRRVFMRSPSPMVELAYASTITPDFAVSNQQFTQLTGNVIINPPSNMAVGDFMTLDLIQDGTGGRTPTFHADYIKSDWDIPGTLNTRTTIGIRRVNETDYHVSLADTEVI